MALSYTITTKSRLQRLFDTCVITPAYYPVIDERLKQIVKAKPRYELVSHKTKVPWHITGIIHSTICGCDFKTHLINGDSLNGRTLNIPTGLPRKGRPPFAWEESAEDAIRFYHLDKWADWSLPGMLYTLELVDRESHSNRGEQPSKVWCLSNHFSVENKTGAEVCGSAVLLRRMVEKNVIKPEIAYDNRLSEIKELGAEVSYLPHRVSPKVFELQRLLNLSGAYLREDGRAGKFTAMAYYDITQTYLDGDPDNQ